MSASWAQTKNQKGNLINQMIINVMKQIIHTSAGTYSYAFRPIFAGIKPIDKVIAKENLFLLKDICDEAGLKFILFYGTLLGAIREHDFITHDEDIDLRTSTLSCAKRTDRFSFHSCSNCGNLVSRSLVRTNVAFCLSSARENT